MFVFRLLSRLPLRVLYGLAGGLYVLLAHVVRYRRRVIAENLRASFPDVSDADLKRLIRGFYHNLTDLLVEVIKLPALPADELRRRLVFQNADVATRYLRRGQSILIMASHQANWEWLPPAAVLNDIPADIVYKTLENSFFDELVRHVRSSFGVYPIPMHRLARELATRRNVVRSVALVADQMPDMPEHAHWIPFLHRNTPFYTGTERLARSLQWPVLYIELTRVRRGHYVGTFHVIAEPPYHNLPDGAILERYRDRLEATIRQHPADWLWSHRRWKHQREKYGHVRTKFS